MRNVSSCLLLVVLLAGCDGLSAHADERLELAANERRWASLDLQDYRYTYTFGCFCPVETTGPFEVTVRGGEVDTVRWLFDLTPEYPPDPRFLEADDLFSYIGEALDEGADEIEVEYDPETSLPAWISIDYHRDAVDDEVGVTLNAFERL